MKTLNIILALIPALMQEQFMAHGQDVSQAPQYTLGSQIKITEDPTLSSSQKNQIEISEEVMSSKVGRLLFFDYAGNLLTEKWDQGAWEERDRIFAKLAALDVSSYSDTEEQARYYLSYMMNIIGGSHKIEGLLKNDRVKKMVRAIHENLIKINIETCQRAMAACLWIEVQQLVDIDFGHHQLENILQREKEPDPIVWQIFYGAKFQSELKKRDTESAFKVFENSLLPSYKKSGVYFTDNGQFRPFVAPQNMFVSVDGVYNSINIDRYYANQKDAVKNSGK